MIRKNSNFEFASDQSRFLIRIRGAKRVTEPMDTQKTREDTIIIDCHSFICT
jgi:hypothetical protein